MDIVEAYLVKHDGNGMKEGDYLSRSQARGNSYVLYRTRVTITTK